MTDEFNSDSSDNRKSKYNASIAALYRIDELWKDAHKCKKTFAFILWNIALDSVWSELSEDTKEEDDKLFIDFNKRLNDLGLFSSKERPGFTLTPSEETRKQAMLYQLLLSKEIWLRRLQNKQGKGAAYKEALEDYMD